MEVDSVPPDASEGIRHNDYVNQYNHLMELARSYDQRGSVSHGLHVREQLLVCAKHAFGEKSAEVHRACESFVIRCNQAAMLMLKDDMTDAAFELLRKAEMLSDKNGILSYSPAARMRCRAVTLNNFGLFYRNRGQPHAALNYLEQALEIESSTHDDNAENPSATLLNMCAVLSSMQKYQAALGYAIRALASLNKKGRHAARFGSTVAPSHHTMLAVAHHSAGCQYEGIKMYAKAAEQYSKAVLMARQAGADDQDYCRAHSGAVNKARASGKVHESALPQLPPESREHRALKRSQGQNSVGSPGKARPLSGVSRGTSRGMSRNTTNTSYGLSSTPGSTFNVSRPSSSAKGNSRRYPKVRSAPSKRQMQSYDEYGKSDPHPPTRPLSGGATKRTHHYHGNVRGGGGPNVRSASDAYAALGNVLPETQTPHPPKVLPSCPAARKAYNLVYKPAANLAGTLSKAHLEAFEELERLSLSRLDQYSQESPTEAVQPQPVHHAPRRPPSSASSRKHHRTESRIEMDVGNVLLSHRSPETSPEALPITPNESISEQPEEEEEVESPMVVSPQGTGDLSCEQSEVVSPAGGSDECESPGVEGGVVGEELIGVSSGVAAASVGAALFVASVAVVELLQRQEYTLDVMPAVFDDPGSVTPRVNKSRRASSISLLSEATPAPVLAVCKPPAAPDTNMASKDIVSKVVALGVELDSLHDLVLSHCASGKVRERTVREKERQKRCLASIDIQRMWRGCIGKRRWNNEKQMCEAKQREEFRMFLRQEHSACTIQRCFRVFTAMCVKNAKLEESRARRVRLIYHAATTIQASARSRISLKKFTQIRDRRVGRAVRFAQALWRGKDARSTFNHIKRDWAEKQKVIEFGSASRIQGWWRRILGHRRREEVFQKQWSELVHEKKPSFAAGRIQLWYRWLVFERLFVQSVNKVTFERSRARKLSEETERLQKSQLDAVLTIQQAFRRYLALRQTGLKREEDLMHKIAYLTSEETDFAARVLQSFSRLVHAWKNVRRRTQEIAEFAALRSWKESKEAQAKAEAESARLLNLAASRIQSVWRWYFERKTDLDARMQELLAWEAQCAPHATCIARTWRGFVSRRLTQPLRERRQHQHRSATTIQCAWRMSTGRVAMKARHVCAVEALEVRVAEERAALEKVVQLERQQRCAQQVQAHARACLARCVVATQQMRSEVRNEAALVLQEWFGLKLNETRILCRAEEAEQARDKENEFAREKAELAQLEQEMLEKEAQKREEAAVEAAQKLKKEAEEKEKEAAVQKLKEEEEEKEAAAMKLKEEEKAAAALKLKEEAAAAQKRREEEAVAQKRAEEEASAAADKAEQMALAAMQVQAYCRGAHAVQQVVEHFRQREQERAVSVLVEHALRLACAIEAEEQREEAVRQKQEQQKKDRGRAAREADASSAHRIQMSCGILVQCFARAKLSVFVALEYKNREQVNAATAAEQLGRQDIVNEQGEAVQSVLEVCIAMFTTCKEKAVVATALTSAARKHDAQRCNAAHAIQLSWKQSRARHTLATRQEDVARHLSAMARHDHAAVVQSFARTFLALQAAHLLRANLPPSPQAYTPTVPLLPTESEVEAKPETLKNSSACVIQRFFHQLVGRRKLSACVARRAQQINSIVQNDAAIAIQSVMRRWKAFLLYRAMIRRNEASRVICRSLLIVGARRRTALLMEERSCAGDEVRRGEAALVIQTANRSSLARAAVSQQRQHAHTRQANVVRQEAASVLTRFLRRSTARRALKERIVSPTYALKQEASSSIQALFRGYVDRQRIKPLVERRRLLAARLAHKEERIFAALVIQNWYRGLQFK